MVDASGGCLLLGDDVDAVDDAGDVSAQLEQQGDQDLVLSPFFIATDTGGRKKAIRTSRTVIVLLDTGSGTGVRGGTRKQLPLSLDPPPRLSNARRELVDLVLAEGRG